MHGRPPSGFSLIETGIVILILGIIAAVATPRMFDTATTADESTTRQHLQVLRNAIEMYRARDGAYPLANDLPSALASFLNGPFPSPSVGTHRGDVDVYYDVDDRYTNGSHDLGFFCWRLGLQACQR